MKIRKVIIPIIITTMNFIYDAHFIKKTSKSSNSYIDIRSANRHLSIISFDLQSITENNQVVTEFKMKKQYNDTAGNQVIDPEISTPMQ